MENMEAFLAIAVIGLAAIFLRYAFWVISWVIDWVIAPICLILLFFVWVLPLYPSPVFWLATAGVFLASCGIVFRPVLENKQKKTIEFMVDNDLIEDTITNTGKRGYRITDKGLRKLGEMEANGGARGILSVAYSVLSDAQRFSEKERSRARHDSTGTPEPE